MNANRDNGSISSSTILKPLHSDNPHVCDTYAYFGHKYCDLKRIRQAELDQRNLRSCEILDVSWSNIERLTAESLENLKDLRAEWTHLDLCGTKPFYYLESLNLQGCLICELPLLIFPALKSLDVSYTDLAAFDSTYMTYLQHLNIGGTNISSLDTCPLTELRSLEIWNTKISSLDTNLLVKLKMLVMDNCSVEQLSTKSLTALEVLHINDTGITELDAIHMKRLKILNICSTRISSIDTRNLTELKEFWAAGTYLNELETQALGGLMEMDISFCPIQELDTMYLVSLVGLDIYETQIVNLNVEPMSELRRLYVSRNQILNIKVSCLNKLSCLYVDSTSITELDISNLRLLDLLDLCYSLVESLIQPKHTPYDECGVNAVYVINRNLVFEGYRPGTSRLQYKIQEPIMRLPISAESKNMQFRTTNFRLSYAKIEALQTLERQAKDCAALPRKVSRWLADVEHLSEACDIYKARPILCFSCQEQHFRPIKTTTYHVECFAYTYKPQDYLRKLLLDCVCLTVLDTSYFSRMEELDISRTNIYRINLRSMPNLRTFSCYFTLISMTDLYACKKLKQVNVGWSLICKIGASIYNRLLSLNIFKSRIKHFDQKQACPNCKIMTDEAQTTTEPPEAYGI